MCGKIFLLTFITFFQYEAISAQRQWVLPTTTAAEMRNPYTWYWPYAIAASEAYRDYFTNAQQITNQLYFQAYVTQAFPWSSQPENSNPVGPGYSRWGWRIPKQGSWNGKFGRNRMLNAGRTVTAYYE